MSKGKNISEKMNCAGKIDCSFFKISIEQRIKKLQMNVNEKNECKEILNAKADIFIKNPELVEILLELETLLTAYYEILQNYTYIHGLKDGMDLMASDDCSTHQIRE